MNNKRIIIVTSIILIITLFSFTLLKLYNTYALSNNIDNTNNNTYNIVVTDNSIIEVPANSTKKVFYMIDNTNPGTVNYNVAYKTISGISVKCYSNIGDLAKGLIEENEKKYIKLRITNSNSSAKSVELSTILGYSTDDNLIVPSGYTLVSNPVTIASYITNLYTNADKSEVEKNSITYNYATSVSLMNDRLGGTTSDYDAGNIRYYGANPNNYIYFNCSDYSNQNDTTCEKWRIIGVFNGKIKLIRNESIGKLAWDYDKNIDSSLTTYDNDWSTSSLKVLLNEKYYNGNTTGTVTYYSNGISTNLDMSSIGIKNETTRNIISEEIYYLNKGNYGSKYLSYYYINERASTNLNDKIAIPYASDYGYAADFSYCKEVLNKYSDSTCTSNNWMKNIITNNGNDDGWLLNSYSETTRNAFQIISKGYLYVSRYSNNTANALGVVPVLHLNSNIEISDIGDGSESNPYRISI